MFDLSPLYLNLSEEKNPLFLHTTEQVKESPELHTDKPASRQHEMDYYRYNGCIYY
jgi:hypothetical protein